MLHCYCGEFLALSSEISDHNGLTMDIEYVLGGTFLLERTTYFLLWESYVLFPFSDSRSD